MNNPTVPAIQRCLDVAGNKNFVDTSGYFGHQSCGCRHEIPPAMGNTVGCTIYYVSVAVKDRSHLLDLHSVVLIENDEIAAVMVSVRDQGVRVETDCQLGSQKSLKGALGRKHRRFSRAR